MSGDVHVYRFGPEPVDLDDVQITTTADADSVTITVNASGRLCAAFVRSGNICSARSDKLGENSIMGTLIANADSPAIAADPHGGRTFIVYRDANASEVRFDWSDDDLATVSGSPVTIRTGESSSLPIALCVTPEHRLIVVLVSGGLVTYRSTDAGASWGILS